MLLLLLLSIEIDECLALSWQEVPYLEMDTFDAGTLAPVHTEMLGR